MLGLAFMLDKFEQQTDAARTVIRAAIILIMIVAGFTAIVLW